MARPDLAELEITELETTLVERGRQAYHARQLFRWIYRRGQTDVRQMTDLSRTLRANLLDEFD